MKKTLLILFITLMFTSCGKSEKRSKTVAIEPSEQILKAHKNTDFSIVLDDMDIKEESNVIAYKHKYKVLKLVDDSLHVEKKDWATVNESFFVKHKNDLGMEILSKHDNKITRVAQPVGFGWAIGNSQHGEWEETKTDSTKSNHSSRRWRTHSTSPFFWYWLGTRRNTYRTGYNTYESNRSRGTGYYGRPSGNGNYEYGTRSEYQKKQRSSFFSRKSNNSSRWNVLNKKTSKSSSRYKNGSSTRSRSGGTGK